MRVPPKERKAPDVVLASEALRRAAFEIGAVSGRQVAPDDVLDRLFGDFCIGPSCPPPPSLRPPALAALAADDPRRASSSSALTVARPPACARRTHRKVTQLRARRSPGQPHARAPSPPLAGGRSTTTRARARPGVPRGNQSTGRRPSDRLVTRPWLCRRPHHLRPHAHTPTRRRPPLDHTRPKPASPRARRGPPSSRANRPTRLRACLRAEDRCACTPLAPALPCSVLSRPAHTVAACKCAARDVDERLTDPRASAKDESRKRGTTLRGPTAESRRGRARGGMYDGHRRRRRA